MRPIHPGEILEEEFLKPLKASGLTASSLANAIGVPPNRITAIIKGQRGITGDTAVRLSEFFGNTAKFWMNLQASYDLRMAEDALSKRALKHIQERRAVLVSI
jgi:addiction module HigA family antidote